MPIHIKELATVQTIQIYLKVTAPHKPYRGTMPALLNNAEGPGVA